MLTSGSCPVPQTQQVLRYSGNESYQGSWAGPGKGNRRLCAAGCTHVQITQSWWSETRVTQRSRQLFSSCPNKTNQPLTYHSARRGRIRKPTGVSFQWAHVPPGLPSAPRASLTQRWYKSPGRFGICCSSPYLNIH